MRDLIAMHFLGLSPRTAGNVGACLRFTTTTAKKTTAKTV